MQWVSETRIVFFVAILDVFTKTVLLFKKSNFIKILITISTRILEEQTVTKKVFYEKVGRRYRPVSEYDSDYLHSFPKGTHLVMVYPGGQSCRFNIDPNYAALIAAGRVAEDAIADAVVKAGELRLQRQDRERRLTQGQQAAWDNLVKEFGDSARQLEWPSAREVAEQSVKAMMQEADQLMTNPAVRKAYDYFQMVCDLTREQAKQ
jgi:hypothetical protein